MATSERRPVYRVPWTEAMKWLRAMVREIREDQDRWGHFKGVYAVPEGGAFPATVVAVALDLPIVSEMPTDETHDQILIVDDDLASGETMRELLERVPDPDVQARAVVHARVADVVTTYRGAKDEAPEGCRLLWPWDYQATRPWGLCKAGVCGAEGGGA